ncbi:MAG: exodeoxyribonuclease III [Actinomycetaceae bacterium]|nr:exodeoxyribonuclease III [Actinomycetaceae bacterium]
MSVTIASVNVNGIRAAMRKGMPQWLKDCGADIVLTQEVRAPHDVAATLFGDEWLVYNAVSDIKGRAGVGVAVRKQSGITVTDTRSHAIPAKVPEDSGRWLEVDLLCNDVALTVVSAYFHSGELGSQKQDYKYSHLERIDARLEQLRTYNDHSVICGDFNIVHTERDIKNWKPNHNKRAGVLDEEIAYLDRWMTGKWVDVARSLAGNVQGPYTWWSWRGKAFDNDAGWRIDYHMATPQLATCATNARVDRADSYDQRFSDHAPVIITYDLDTHKSQSI